MTDDLPNVVLVASTTGRGFINASVCLSVTVKVMNYLLTLT